MFIKLTPLNYLIANIITRLKFYLKYINKLFEENIDLIKINNIKNGNN